jgi:putative NADPH-quinone reductase
MKTIIVYAHPWEGSYNHAVKETVVSALQKSSRDYDLIDLYADNFQASMEKENLALYNKGESQDSLVKKYQKMIDDCDNLVLIFPIWWSTYPAILKGFLDKVLLSNWAYNYEGFLPKGKLDQIKKAYVLTTMGGPEIFYRLFLGNFINVTLMRGTLMFCGIKKMKWLNLSSIKSSSQRKREKHLKKIEKIFQGAF